MTRDRHDFVRRRMLTPRSAARWVSAVAVSSASMERVFIGA
jgi:hypothetical protein